MRKVSRTKSGRLATKLRRIRLDLELSQSRILERLGFSDDLFRSNISQYERGHRVPSPLVILEYARLANVDVAVLIDDDLDLPDSIPSPKRSDGIRRSSKSRKK